MKRSNPIKPKPDAILCADFHLREDQPVCRTDDFPVAQWLVLDQVKELQKRYDCPVLHSGDLFHHWKPSPALLTETMTHLPAKFWTIYGNHDLPQHSLELKNKSGVYTLWIAGHLNVIFGTHWGQLPCEDGKFKYHLAGKNILVWHIMTYQAKTPWPGCEDPMAGKLLRKYPAYDLILTGHNHKTFVEEHEGRLLVNPGSLTRQTSDQINHRPCVFLWYAKTNTVEQVFLNVPEGVISREHIEVQEQREGRIEAFISRLNEDWEAAISFEENIQRCLFSNKVEKEVENIVINAMEK